jgi:excisionase family DNA binding protein
MLSKKRFRDYPDVLDVHQMCKLIGIGLTTGYGIIRSETIPAIKVGRSYRILKTNVIRYLDTATTQK